MKWRASIAGASLLFATSGLVACVDPSPGSASAPNDVAQDETSSPPRVSPSTASRTEVTDAPSTEETRGPTPDSVILAENVNDGTVEYSMDACPVDQESASEESAVPIREQPPTVFIGCGVPPSTRAFEPQGDASDLEDVVSASVDMSLSASADGENVDFGDYSPGDPIDISVTVTEGVAVVDVQHPTLPAFPVGGLIEPITATILTNQPQLVGVSVLLRGDPLCLSLEACSY